jgi:hypothetical protein
LSAGSKYRSAFASVFWYELEGQYLSLAVIGSFLSGFGSSAMQYSEQFALVEGGV